MKKIIGILFVVLLIGLGIYKLNEISNQDIVVNNIETVARVTGPTLPDEDIPNPNQTDKNYSVRATDLGIIWDATTNEDDPKVMLVFGDTYDNGWFGFGGGGSASGWRSNVLAISKDQDLSDGLEFDFMITDPSDSTYAKEIIESKKETHGYGDFTTIPTAGITVGNIHYIHYMQIKKWGEAGHWDTNFSEIAYSEDEGENWIKSGVSWDAESNFAQAAFVKEDGYVYIYGTPSGRFGNLYIARVEEEAILDKHLYEYWDGNDWIIENETVASPIIEAPVSELSVQYNSYFDQWIMLYLNEDRYSLVMRTSDDLTGEWSLEEVVVTGEEYPMLYGSYIHPWTNNSNDLYFVISEWEPYNVILLRADLKKGKVEE